jgi:ArsR family metal-binding transcriptional regulator
MGRDRPPERLADHGRGDAVTEPNLDDYEDQEQPLEAAAGDFDAFFGEEVDKGKRQRQTVTVCGKTYVLPDSLPLMFTLSAERVQQSQNIDDVRKMLAPLFGRSALDDWADGGMTDRQFRIVLMYSAANVRTPGSLTMAAAARIHDEQEAAKAAGKVPTPANRAERRKSSKKRRSSGKR